MSRLLMRFLVCMVVLPLLASCGSFRAYGGYMKLQTDGSFGLQESSPGPTTPGLGDIKVDIDDQMDIKEAETPYARVELEGGPWIFSVSGFQYDERGSVSLPQPFGDLPAGTAVNTDLTISNVKASLTYDVLDFGFLRASAGLSLDVFDVDFDVTAPSVSGFERIDFLAPVPMLFVQAEANVGIVAGVVEVGGLSIDLDDAKGNFWDVDVMVKVSPLPFLEAFAGYRFISLDALGVADGQDFDTELRMQGWYIGAGVTF